MKTISDFGIRHIVCEGQICRFIVSICPALQFQLLALLVVCVLFVLFVLFVVVFLVNQSRTKGGGLSTAD